MIYPYDKDIEILVSGDGVTKYRVKSSGAEYAIDSSFVMRCLNIKDKNGKEIYEDDIVMTDEAGWIAQVIFSWDGFICEKKNAGFSTLCNWEGFEVLGNIYENPEKLEGEPIYDRLPT
jgi:uncharacterized phage protein (TIGR01671 family)